jgi:16S rRNA (cytosine967-C5)-methyltransferase
VSAKREREPISPARVCAYKVIRRVFEQGAYADRALRGEAAGLAPRDRALATQLAFGTVQRRATLDYVAARFSNRPAEKLDAPVLAAVRLGLFQLLFLGGVADHAAVNESVELCKRFARGGAGFVNAVLRRAAREGRGVLEALDDSTPEAAAVLHSVPGWLATQWFSELGADQARALLAVVNEPAEAAVRVNTLKAPDGLTLPVRARTAPGLPEGLVLEEPFDVHRSEPFADGLVIPQSRASMAVARALDPRPGERILDLCAAPGAKTTHLAALAGGDAEIIAVELHPGRAQALRETCVAMGAANVSVLDGDAREYVAPSPFDRVLVDPPCTGFGTLQSRPDLRWRREPSSIPELAGLQRAILDAGGAALRPGGTLVYSVCTISRAESEGVIDAFLDANPRFSEVDRRQLLPHRDRTDGFFIARLVADR